MGLKWQQRVKIHMRKISGTKHSVFEGYMCYSMWENFAEITRAWGQKRGDGMDTRMIEVSEIVCSSIHLLSLCFGPVHKLKEETKEHDRKKKPKETNW